MQKKQNTRRSLADSVHKIYAAGMLAIAGFIVGFDSESSSIAQQMVECVEDTSIPICMVGLLVALPNTQLSRRLQREGRLFPFDWLESALRDHGGDQCTLGLNFHTLRPRRAVLADYKRVIDTVYDAAAYFARARHVVQQLGQWPPHATSSNSPPIREWRWLGLGAMEWLGLLRLLKEAARINLRTFFHIGAALIWSLRKRPGALFAMATFAAFYVHLGPFARRISLTTGQQIEALDRGRWDAPSAA